MASTSHDLTSLVARILLSTIFILAGIEKITGYEGSAQYMEAYGLPAVLLPGAIVVELGGGLAILLGLFSRYAALVLAVFCLVTAAIFHSTFTGEGSQTQIIMFMKNIAITGGLLLLFANGPGRFALKD
ncbi:MAG: DoxX family protein [Hyphomicrobium sp.]|jgi:putative oxidoreductase